MRREREAFEAAGVGVVLVVTGTPGQADAFRRDDDPPYPVVTDEACDLSRRYGLRRMEARDVFVPRALMRVLTRLAQGYGGKASGSVGGRLPGVFIVDRDGRVRFEYLACDIADVPSPRSIVEAAETLQGSLLAGGP